jgi:hypothetical protein
VIKRTLMIVALGGALLAGGVIAVHASSHAATAVHSDVTLKAVGDQTADTDASASCTGQGTAAEAGNCTDSQNSSGPEDTTGAAASETTGAAAGETAGEGATGAMDTDNVESGP